MTINSGSLNDSSSAFDPNLIRFCHQLADASRKIALDYFGKPNLDLDIELKSDQSPVSLADKAIERCLRQMINDNYPGHQILGEEFGHTGNSDAQWQWNLDPIDGTKSFISGNVCFGTLIGLSEFNKPVFGMIDLPALDKRYVGYGNDNQQSFCNDVAIKTRPTNDLSSAIAMTTSPDFFSEDEYKQYQRVSKQCGIRVFGGDCYAYSLLAGGFIDVVMEAGLKSHDIMALIPVIQGAGGIITDWQGKALNPNNANHQVLACSNALIHEKCLALIH